MSSGTLDAAQDLHLTLEPNGSRSYDLSPSVGGVLKLNLASGDVVVAASDSSQHSSVRSAFDGAGTSSVSIPALPAGDLYHLVLSSRQGASLTLSFNPGAASSGVNVTTSSSHQAVSGGSSVSSSSSSTVISNSSSSSSGTTSTSVNVSHRVTHSVNGSAVH